MKKRSWKPKCPECNIKLTFVKKTKAMYVHRHYRCDVCGYEADYGPLWLRESLPGKEVINGLERKTK